MFAERSKNSGLEAQLHDNCDRLKKYEAEIRKKEEKNEALLLEIRSLNDALIVEKAHKQVAVPPPRPWRSRSRGGRRRSAGRAGAGRGGGCSGSEV